MPAYVEACNIALANDWRLGGVVYSTEEKWDALKAMLQAGGGEPCRLGALISCTIKAPRVSLDTITSSDLAGEASVAGTRSRRERINAIVPRYRSEDHGWEMVPAAVVKVDDYITEDGGQRTREIEYRLVQDAGLAAQLAAYDIVDAREFGPIVLPLKPRWIGYKPGDCLTIDVPELNMVDQAAIVLNRSLDPSTGVVTLTLRSETPAKHDFALGRTPNPPPTPSLQVIDPSQLLVPGVSANWSQIADDDPDDHPRPEDGATVGGRLGDNLLGPDGELLFPSEILNEAISLSADGRLYATIEGVPQLLGSIDLPSLGAASDSARRQLEDDLARIGEAVARLAAGQARVTGIFRDAGLYIDPASGVAKLFAIERTGEQLANLSVTLNAALASINLKASVDYVNEQILAASLDPDYAPDVEAILVRLTSAEADIDGLAASILLKADATTLTTLTGTVSSVQTALDALAATVSTKASQTVVDAQETRLTAAETTLSAMDGASISQAVTASRRAPVDADRAGAAAITALTLADRAARQAQTGISQARQELTASVTGALDALAAARLSLAVQIGAAQASVATEQAARISGDAASATALAAYQATTNGSLATISTTLGTHTTSLSALSASLSTYQASNDGAVATINADLAAKATAISANATAISSLSTSVGGSFATVNATLTAQSSSLGTIAGNLSSLTTTVGGHTATLTSYGSSIDGLALRNGVELDVDGYITGFVQNNDGTRGDFLILADRFAVGSPGNPSNVPFEVVGGVTYMKSAVLRNATIGTLKLVDGSVTKAVAVRLVTGVYGDGTTQVPLSITFTLPYAATLRVDAVGSHSYAGTVPPFAATLALDGVQMGPGTGAGVNVFATAFPLMELTEIAAGTHTIDLLWYGGGSGIQLATAVLAYSATFK